uniref:Wsv444 n=1 Tax=White spot syndrome virus TaxID=92652 RepID=A0A2U9GE30_WSSV|nr:wsv444 [Shrimp white spot syndrome virus]AWQ63096.1 wsv444 [Shrimp white spot syndrome virus]AWQ63535.1 wsv444 [Shrimp white spot syndrome virus]AWQ63921.1 wsv444 [Shrimp white spot syndrome virus]
MGAVRSQKYLYSFTDDGALSAHLHFSLIGGMAISVKYCFAFKRKLISFSSLTTLTELPSGEFPMIFRTYMLSIPVSFSSCSRANNGLFPFDSKPYTSVKSVATLDMVTAYSLP